MSPDFQEAESRRYGPGAFYVLPLESGRIALLTPRRDLWKIVDSWEEAKAEGPKITDFQSVRVIPEESTVIKVGNLEIKL